MPPDLPTKVMCFQKSGRKESTLSSVFKGLKHNKWALFKITCMIMTIYIKFRWCGQEIMCYKISLILVYHLSLNTLNRINIETFFPYVRVCTHTQKTEGLGIFGYTHKKTQFKTVSVHEVFMFVIMVTPALCIENSCCITGTSWQLTLSLVVNTSI
jgi:hypothetical protein